MSAIPHTEIETERLLLRPIQSSDRPDILRILSKFEVTRWLRSTPHPYPDSAANVFLSKAKERWIMDEEYIFAVVPKDTQIYSGVAALKNIQAGMGEPGYFLDPGCQGKGFATEATRALLDWGRTRLDMNRFRARVMTANQASIRVLEKCGFVPSGQTGLTFAKSLDKEVHFTWLIHTPDGEIGDLPLPPVL